MNIEAVALINVVVNGRGKQVVSRSYGVDVAREVKVDILHGQNLGVSAAGGSAFDAKDGTQ